MTNLSFSFFFLLIVLVPGWVPVLEIVLVLLIVLVLGLVLVGKENEKDYENEWGAGVRGRAQWRLRG